VTAADWDSFDARAQLLSPRKEADLIRDLAAARARKARTHPAVCRCTPCRIRRTDDNRRAVADLLAKAGAP
jgi:Fe-S oxidoreductase